MTIAIGRAARPVDSNGGLRPHRDAMDRFWQPTTGIALALLAALCLALAGCVSRPYTQSYLYNAERDKQAQGAQKAAGEAKLADAITAAEKRNARLLELELDATRIRYAHIRDLEIREIAFSSQPLGRNLLRRIDDRLVKLYGSDSFDTVIARQKVLTVRTKEIQDRRDALEDMARPAPDCAIVEQQPQLPPSVRKQVPPGDIVNAEVLYGFYRTACSRYVAANKDYDAALRHAADTSLLAKAFKELDDEQKRRTDAEALRKAAETALEEAEHEFKNATAILLPGTTDYAEKIAAAAKKLQEALDKIESAQGRAGTEVLAKARLDRIEDVLSAVAGGEVDTSKWSPELRQAVAVAATLPALVDEASRMLREAARPRLVPFELAKEHQRLVLEEARATGAVLDNRIIALTKMVDASVDEANSLVVVRNVVEQWRSKTMDQVTADPSPATRRALYEALGRYFDDVARFQRDQRLWEYRYVATSYDEAIVHSKYAALMWQNLNEGIAATLAGYHGSGIKPETIAEFLKAFGIIVIGIGVN